MFRFFGLLAVASLLCLAPSTAPFAQNQQPQQGGNRFQPNPDRMVERLNRDLTLTPDQQKKIKAIYEKAFKDAAPSGDAGATGAAARRQRMAQQNNAQNDFQKRMEQVNADIRKTLTPEQQKKFDARPRGGGGARNMSVEDRIAQLDQRLKLSADQKKKLQAVYEKQNQAMQKRMEEMRQQGGAQQNVDRQAMMETFRKEREQNQKEVEAVLNPEQLKQYRAMQEEMAQQRQQRQQQGGGNNTQQR